MAEHLASPQARRSFLGVAAVALAFSLGGCQIVPTGEPGPPPAPVEQPKPAPTPAPSPTITPGLPQDPERNRVAVLVPLSGPNGGVGQSIANAANLALADAGAERIRITVYDTARGAGPAANEALADGNRLFLGPLLAEDVQEIAPIARRADVPVIAFSNDVSVAGDGVYIMGFNPTQSIDRLVSYARAQGVQRFAGLIPAGLYGQRSSQALIQAVERSGGRMVAMQTYDRSPSACARRLGGSMGSPATTRC